MLYKAGIAFLFVSAFCVISGASAIGPFVVGIALIAYHNWRESGYIKMPTKRK